MAQAKKIFLMVFLILFSSSCTSTPLSVWCNNKVDEGFRLLADNKPGEAKIAFRDAINKPCNMPDAYAGRGMATIINMFYELNEFLEKLIDLIFQTGIIPSSSPGLSPKQEGLMRLLAPILHQYIFSHLEDAAVDFDEVEKIKFFRRTISSIPLEVKDPVLGTIGFKVDLGGRWDLGDIYFLDSAITFVDGIYKIIISVDFTINLLDLLDLLKYPSIKHFSEEPLFTIGNILAVLLNRNQRLLRVSNDGAGFVQEGENLILEAIGDAREAFNLIKDETPSEEEFITPDEFEENHLAMRFKRFDAFGNPIPVTVSFLANSRLEKALDAVQNDLNNKTQGEDEFRTSWGDHIAVILGITLSGILKSGILTDYINVLCDMLGLSDSGGTNYCDLITNPAILTEDILIAILTTFIPPVMEFDLDDLFSYLSAPNSKGIRGFLPAWTTYENYSSFPPSSTDTIIAEWDCGFNLHKYEASADQGFTSTAPNIDKMNPSLFYLTCKADSLKDSQGNPIPDIPHFSEVSSGNVKITGEFSSSSTAFIPPDNKVSGFPYFIFLDPTMGGSLYVDLSYFTTVTNPVNPCTGGPPPSPVWQKPSNCELNWILANIFGSLAELISSFGGSSP